MLAASAWRFPQIAPFLKPTLQPDERSINFLEFHEAVATLDKRRTRPGDTGYDTKCRATDKEDFWRAIELDEELEGWRARRITSIFPSLCTK